MFGLTGYYLNLPKNDTSRTQLPKIIHIMSGIIVKNGTVEMGDFRGVAWRDVETM